MDRRNEPLPPVRPLGIAEAMTPARPAKVAREPRRRPRVPRLALLVAGAVVLAVVLVWLVFLRDPGNPFAGTWAAPAGAPISGTVVISGPGRRIEATFTGNDASGTPQVFTVRAHKDGEDLVITADDFADAAGDVANAQRVRNTFAAFVKDFSLVFVRQDATHLGLTVEGTFIGVIKVSLAERSIVLTKVD